MAAIAEPAPEPGAKSWARWWLGERNAIYVVQRSRSLVSRYGVTAGRAEARTRRFVQMLALRGHAPTLAVPGRVVARHGGFMRELRDRGVELAVHSFDHVDFRSLDGAARRAQLGLALQAFDDASIPVTGFRCPYLGYDPSMRESVPDRLRYSSNRAVRWPVVADRRGPVVYETLERFYDPVEVGDAPVLPFDVDGLLELPVSVPDDLQLLDGLGCSPDDIGDIWASVLGASRARGDLFVALVHPETADECSEAISGLLDLADAPPRPTWVATLRQVTEWWQEREAFAMTAEGDVVSVACTPRATVLTRGLDVDGPRWDDRWTVMDRRRVALPAAGLPFIGLREPDPGVERALADDGYVVCVAEGAEQCATVLCASDVRRLGTPQGVVHHVGTLDTPAIRFWRWPDGASSCLSITGDLDALSMADYASRLALLRSSTPTTARNGAPPLPSRAAEHPHPTDAPGPTGAPERRGEHPQGM